MARDDVKAKKSGGLFKFLLLNILPIGGLVALMWGVNQGKISLDDLPGGLGRNALYFGVSIALLIITASLLLPMIHGIARHFAARLGWSKELRAHAGAGRKLFEYVLWLPRQLTYRVTALLRFVLVILSIAFILCAVLFMIRFINPEFMEEELKVSEKLVVAEEYVRDFEWKWN